MTSRLAPGEVHVRYRETRALDAGDVAAAVDLLSAGERARYARFRFDRDRRDYAAAHALLRQSLSRYADADPRSWTFREDAGGKPSVVRTPGLPALTFNLSHTHGLVACAVAAGTDVGIDVESVERRVDDAVAERFFSATENAALREAPSDLARANRFFEFWTLKEAYVKAIGKGLSHPLDTIVFDVGEAGAVTFHPPPGVEAADWHFARFVPHAGYRMAVAARRHGHAVSIELIAGE